MQPNMQQIPQPQMINQSQQASMNNPQPIQPQGQLYQIVQQDSTPNRCEKFSEFITGVRNVPLMVFLILMGSSGFFILNLINPFYSFPCLILPSLANFCFALFVWSKMAIKIEKNTSTVRYGALYVINNSILSLVSFGFPLCLSKIWCFTLFETLLIALSNKDKKMKFFCCKLTGNNVIICTIIYHLVFNWFHGFSLILTIIYAFVYQKYLIKKFAISNEKVERIENWCLINLLKNKLQTFITLKEVLEKSQQQQPLVQNNNVQNYNNSSFIPVNMYPNYYSNMQPMQQMPPMPVQPMQPIQPISQAEGIRTIDSNESSRNLNQSS